MYRGPPRLPRRISLLPLAWKESLCLLTHQLGGFCGAWGEVMVGLIILCCVVVMRADCIVHVEMGG